MVLALVAFAVGLALESRCKVLDAAFYLMKYGNWPRSTFCLGGDVEAHTVQRKLPGAIPGGTNV